MGNFIGMVYGTLKQHGIDTKGMTNDEAVKWFNKLNKNIKPDQYEQKKELIKKYSSDPKADLQQIHRNKNNKNTEEVKAIRQKALKLAINVDFADITDTRALNTIVDTLSENMKEYNLRKLEQINIKDLDVGTLAESNGIKLSIDKKFITNPRDSYITAITEFQNTIKLMLNIDKDNELYKELANFNRNLVLYNGEEIKSTITHEIGHIIADQYFGHINKNKYINKNVSLYSRNRKNNIIQRAYDYSLSSGEIYKISYYAGTDVQEFFAECFTVYKMNKESLPKTIELAIKEALKK